MGNAIYKLLTEQARTPSGVNLKTRLLLLLLKLSLIGGLGENGTPGCRGGNGTRITKPALITTSRLFSIKTDYPDRPFLWDLKPCS